MRCQGSTGQHECPRCRRHFFAEANVCQGAQPRPGASMPTSACSPLTPPPPSVAALAAGGEGGSSIEAEFLQSIGWREVKRRRKRGRRGGGRRALVMAKLAELMAVGNLPVCCSAQSALERFQQTIEAVTSSSTAFSKNLIPELVLGWTRRLLQHAWQVQWGSGPRAQPDPGSVGEETFPASESEDNSLATA